MKDYVQLGAVLFIVVGSVFLSRPVTSSISAPRPKALTPQQMQKEIAYEESVRAAKQVLDGYTCPNNVPSLIARVAAETRIPVRILAADVAVESSCNPHAVSKAGAIGLMQVNAKVHKTDKNLFNVAVNISTGARILANNIHQHGYRGGLQRYFGISAGSDASAAYAEKVLRVAYQ